MEVFLKVQGTVGMQGKVIWSGILPGEEGLRVRGEGDWELASTRRTNEARQYMQREQHGPSMEQWSTQCLWKWANS